MANPKIRAKRSSVEGKVPSTTQLERGEFAVNTYDGKVYVVKDQYSVGIATTTVNVNPWAEPNGIGAGVSYSGSVTATSFVGDGSALTNLNVAGVTTFSGNYNHLFNKPTIPSNNNQLTNGAGYITGDLDDDVKLRFGDDNDMEQFFDGTRFKIQPKTTTTTSQLDFEAKDQVYIHSTSNGVFLRSANQSVIDLYGGYGGGIYFKNNGTQYLKLEYGNWTTQNGADFTFTGSNYNIKFDASDSALEFVDDAKAKFGNSDDLQIYHSGGDAYITNSDGNLNVVNSTDGWIRLQPKSGEEGVIVKYDGAVELYHDNSKKLETTSAGVNVTGNITVSGTVDGVDVAALNSTVAGIDTSGFPSGTIPTNNNQLTNGAGYITASSVPTNNNQLTNGQGFITGYTVTSSDVTQHEGDITITESQISDLGTYLTSSDLSSYATQSYVNTQVSNLVDSAPSTLDTLNELAAALGDDANFSTTVTDSIATKMPLAGGTFTGAVTFASGQTFDYNNLTNTPTIPSNNNQLTNGAGFITNSVSGDLTLTDTSTDNSAGPEFVLYRNSSSPSSADYIGQIKFQGESTSGATRLYAKITGKIGDPTNGSEDGIIEIAHRKNGSNNISGRWNQDELQLLNGTELSLGDSQKIKVGTGDDLQIYHDSVNSQIVSTTGDLYVQSDGDDLILQAVDNIFIRPQNGEEGIRVHGNGSTELYYDNNRKLETTSGGIDVNGTIGADALDMEDNHKILLGAGDDLEIYHDGSNSRIKNTTGSLWLQSDTGIRFTDSGVNESMAAFYDNGAVELYYDGSKKFETTSSGATVTGTLTATSFSGDGSSLTGITASAGGASAISMNDGVKINFGDSNDLQIYHDGSNAYIDDAGTGNLKLNGNEVHILSNDNSEYSGRFIQNGAVELYYDGSRKLATRTYGVEITGELECDSLDVDGNADISGILNLGNNLDMPDSAKIILGNGDDLQIYHDSSNSWITDNGTGSLKIRSTDGQVQILGTTSNENMAVFTVNGASELYYDNSKKLETDSSGITVTGTAKIGDVSGDNYVELLQASGTSIRNFSIQHSNASVLENLQGTTNQHLVLGDVSANNSSTLFGISLSSGGTYYNRLTLSGTGNLTISGDITSQSDISLKDNVVTYENALDKVLAMRGVEYDRNDMEGKHEVGLIAQEVEEIIPEVVGEEGGIKNIAYGKLTAVLIEAIKEQQQQINDLRQQLNKGK